MVDLARGLPGDLLVTAAFGFIASLGGFLLVQGMTLAGLGTLLAVSLAALGLIMIARSTLPTQGESTLGLLYLIDAGPIRGTPCRLRGTLRPLPGGGVGVEDRNGVLPVRIPAPLRLHGKVQQVRIADLVGSEVRVTGWYLRTPEPSVTVRRLDSSKGSVKGSWAGIGFLFFALSSGLLAGAVAWFVAG